VAVHPRRLHAGQTQQPKLTIIQTDGAAVWRPPSASNPNLPTPYNSLPRPSSTSFPLTRDGAFTPELNSAEATSPRPPLRPPSLPPPRRETPSLVQVASPSPNIQLSSSEPLSQIGKPKLLSEAPQIPLPLPSSGELKDVLRSGDDEIFGIAGSSDPLDAVTVAPAIACTNSSSALSKPASSANTGLSIQQLLSPTFIINFLEKRLSEYDRLVPRVRASEAGTDSAHYFTDRLLEDGLRGDERLRFDVFQDWVFCRCLKLLDC
jgi:hypothetical protein